MIKGEVLRQALERRAERWKLIRENRLRRAASVDRLTLAVRVAFILYAMAVAGIIIGWLWKILWP